MERYVWSIFYTLSGIVFTAMVIHELRKNYEVTHSSAYVVVEGKRKESIRTSKGCVPVVEIEYNGDTIYRCLDSTKYKNGDKVFVYFNPNSKDTNLRVVGEVDNLKYIIVLLPALMCFGAAFVYAFPELFI